MRMSPVLIEPALPPLPTIWKRPFHSTGRNRANLMLSLIVPRTSQCAGAALPPVSTSGTSVTEVSTTSGAAKLAWRSTHATGSAYAAGSTHSSAAPPAIFETLILRILLDCQKRARWPRHLTPVAGLVAHVARDRLVDERGPVVREARRERGLAFRHRAVARRSLGVHVALARRIVCSGFDRGHIARVGPVALLQRQARLLTREALRLGLGEGNHAADIVAHLPSMESRRSDVPAEIRPERCIAQHSRYAAKLVPVGVDFRHHGLYHAVDRRRYVGR